GRFAGVAGSALRGARRPGGGPARPRSRGGSHPQRGIQPPARRGGAAGPGNSPGPRPGRTRSAAVRQERLRLVLRDLAASAAFGAMAVSGQVPLWALCLFLLALAGAVAGTAPR